MKVTVETPSNTGVNPSEMIVGQVGRFVTGPYVGDHCLRAYPGLIRLENPSSTWSNPSHAGNVIILPKGTKINLETEV